MASGAVPAGAMTSVRRQRTIAARERGGRTDQAQRHHQHGIRRRTQRDQLRQGTPDGRVPGEERRQRRRIVREIAGVRDGQVIDAVPVMQQREETTARRAGVRLRGSAAAQATTETTETTARTAAHSSSPPTTAPGHPRETPRTPWSRASASSIEPLSLVSPLDMDEHDTADLASRVRHTPESVSSKGRAKPLARTNRTPYSRVMPARLRTAPHNASQNRAAQRRHPRSLVQQRRPSHHARRRGEWLLRLAPGAEPL